MGKVEDYINSLDGKENLSVVEVARELLELHNEEVTIREARISSLEQEKDGLASTIAEKDSEITKAKNLAYDYMLQIPAESTGDEGNQPDGEVVDQKRITLDDAFAQ